MALGLLGGTMTKLKLHSSFFTNNVHHIVGKIKSRIIRVQINIKHQKLLILLSKTEKVKYAKLCVSELHRKWFYG